jgi:hypothetical protein
MDRHIRDEQEQHMRGRLEGIDGELAGLAKVHRETRMACANANLSNASSRGFGWCSDVTTEPVEAITYTAGGKKTRMWVAIFAVMPDRTADRNFDIGFSGFCNDGLISKFALHPELHRALLDIGKRFSSARTRAICAKDFKTGFNPAAGRGMVGERRSRVANRVANADADADANADDGDARKELNSGLSSWAIDLKLDWEEREEQREWDFLFAVYGVDQANVIADMHPLDMQAFSLYIRGYDMWTCKFTGNMYRVLSYLDTAC